MSKYLIINADDFGMCRAANLAVFELFEKGGITSATIMMPCSWSIEACKWAAANPQYPVGIHLTFTSEWGKYRWRPVALSGVDSLCDEFGYMFPENDEFEESCDIDEVETEFRAQVALAKKLGLEPSHLDNHMGSLYGLNGNSEVMPKTFELCGEMGYGFRMFRKIKLDNVPHDFPKDLSLDVAKMFVDGYAKLADMNNVPIVDHVLFTGWNDHLRSSYENFREFSIDRLEKIEEGDVTELFIHPSLECDELKGITSTWQNRVWEYKLYGDPVTRQHLESKGIEFISYRELAKMYKEGKKGK